MYLPLALANKPAIERRSMIAVKITLLAAVAVVGFGIGPVPSSPDRARTLGFSRPIPTLARIADVFHTAY
jgi:hypothetical protein